MANNVYILDTNVFLLLHNTSEVTIRLPARIWQALEQMMQNGTLISHRYVYNEIVYTAKKHKGKFQPRAPDPLVKWMQLKKHFFLNRNNFQINKVQSIINRFPKLIDPEKEKNDADSWIIALAIEISAAANSQQQTSLLEELPPKRCGVVVTHENPRSPEKIPAACKAFNIRCITSREFFEENNVALA